MKDTDSSEAHINTSYQPDNSNDSKEIIKEKSFGRCVVFGKTKFGQYKYSIGPHWGCSIIGQLSVIAAGLLIMVFLWHSFSLFIKVIYLCMYIYVICLYFALFISNPGIVVRDPQINLSDDESGTVQLYCDRCNTLRSDNVFHCSFCDVCIKKHDHHCVWIGKCVGQRNLYLFYVFTVSLPVYFVFLIIVSSLINGHKHK